jgi:hypothetical protein
MPGIATPWWQSWHSQTKGYPYPCCISFEGAGRYVAVSVVDEEKYRITDVETREFEYQVKRFLETI